MKRLLLAVLSLSLVVGVASAQKHHKGKGGHKGQQDAPPPPPPPSDAPPPPPSPPPSHGGKLPESDPFKGHMSLGDADTYMSTVVHNYIAEHSVKGVWIVKDKEDVWRLKPGDMVEDSTVKLGDRQFAACFRLKTVRDPSHQLDVDFTVDFSENPWTVKEYVIHQVDGRVKHPRPKPKDEDDEPATDRAAAPS